MANLELTDVAVIGAGGHAKVVISVLQAAGFRPLAAFDDNAELAGRELLGVPVVAGPPSPTAVNRGVIGVGDNRARARLAAELELEWVSAVHPRAWLHDSVEVGDGSIVCAGALVQPDVRIGRHAIVNTGARIDHDCRIGDAAHIAPGATLTGDIRVGEGAFLGAGCTVVRGVTIGAWATVGAGATVIRDVPPGSTVMGVPAR